MYMPERYRRFGLTINTFMKLKDLSFKYRESKRKTNPDSNYTERLNLMFPEDNKKRKRKEVIDYDELR